MILFPHLHIPHSNIHHRSSIILPSLLLNSPADEKQRTVSVENVLRHSAKKLGNTTNYLKQATELEAEMELLSMRKKLYGLKEKVSHCCLLHFFFFSLQLNSPPPDSCSSWCWFSILRPCWSIMGCSCTLLWSPSSHRRMASFTSICSNSPVRFS